MPYGLLNEFCDLNKIYPIKSLNEFDFRLKRIDRKDKQKPKIRLEISNVLQTKIIKISMSIFEVPRKN